MTAVADRVAWLDALDEAQAARELERCCGAAAWVRAMLAARPFSSLDGLLAAAERAADTLEETDWLEAFSHHPRIGGRTDDAWAAREQGSMSTAAESTRQELDRLNREYDERFGFVYLVCATGRTPDELLQICRDRIDNTREVELANAAGEQRAITALRLRKLVAPEGGDA